jgi:hypothetical protein
VPPRERIPAAVIRRVVAAAGDRCGYCLTPQCYILGPLEIDHIIPFALGGTDDESNLWLACSVCNRHKSQKIVAVDPATGQTVRLFNPRTDRWADHFRWSPDGIRVIGQTPIGRATVLALQLDCDKTALTVRRALSEPAVLSEPP